MPFTEALDRMLASGETFVFPDLYLEPGDWRACIRRANAFRPTIGADARVAGVPVGRLALENVSRSRLSHAFALAYGPLVRRLSEAGIRPARIIHTYEGHGWELAMIRAVRECLPESKVIGYENLNMSRFALSMYPADSELAIRPMPDSIVTNGPAFARVLVEEGVPADRVCTGCAMRHGSLHDARSVSRLRGSAFTRVLVATDGTLGHAAELVAKACTALGGDPRFEVAVKCHPLVAVDRVRTLIGRIADHGNVRFVDEPIAELLARTDVMLYMHTVVCYEALVQGVPPVFVQSESVVDLDQLEPVRELRAAARAPSEIRDAVDTIMRWSESELAEWRRVARAAAREALAPIVSDCVEPFLR
jgi:surface carbohydrate biosynthesis protein (TIGR04326 family)